MRYIMCVLALTTAFGAVAGTLMLEEDAATGGLVAVKIADGRAGCAWVLPDRVNGAPARFRDPLANDQDWSLVYYLRHFED